MPITIFDGTVIALLLLSGGVAFWRGFVREVLSVTAFVTAALATLFVMDALLEPAEQALSPLLPPLAARLLVIAIVFLLVYIAVSVATTSLADVLSSSGDGVGFIDRTAGLVFGLARGLVVAALALIIYVSAPGPEDWMETIANSQTYPLVRATAEATLDVVEAVSGPNTLTDITFPGADGARS